MLGPGPGAGGHRHRSGGAGAPAIDPDGLGPAAGSYYGEDPSSTAVRLHLCHRPPSAPMTTTRLDATEAPQARSVTESGSYADWSRLADAFPPLSPEQTVRLLRAAHGESEQDDFGRRLTSQTAATLLIAHNARFVLSEARRYSSASLWGSTEDRNDLLSWAKLGFWKAIRRYDEEAAVERGEAGKRKTFHGYARIWIRKYVGAASKEAQFGLSEDVALDRKKVLETASYLADEFGRRPTDEEVVDELEARGHSASVEKVHALRKHQLPQEHESLDAPVGDEGEGGATIADHVADGDRVDAHTALEQKERSETLLQLLKRIRSRKTQLLLRMSQGLENEVGTARHEPMNDEELAMIAGVGTRATVQKALARIERELRGEVEAPIGNLMTDEVPYTEADVRSASLGSDRMAAIEGAIRDELDLLDVIAGDGIPLEVREGHGEAECPLDAACPGRLLVAPKTFRCTSCGQEGDVFDWLEDYRGLSPHDARVQARQSALHLPESARIEGDKVIAKRVPERDRRLRQVVGR